MKTNSPAAPQRPPVSSHRCAFVETRGSQEDVCPCLPLFFFFSNVIHSCALTEATKGSLALWGLETAADVGIRKTQE